MPKTACGAQDAEQMGAIISVVSNLSLSLSIYIYIYTQLMMMMIIDIIVIIIIMIRRGVCMAVAGCRNRASTADPRSKHWELWWSHPSEFSSGAQG